MISKNQGFLILWQTSTCNVLLGVCDLIVPVLISIKFLLKGPRIFTFGVRSKEVCILQVCFTEIRLPHVSLVEFLSMQVL